LDFECPHLGYEPIGVLFGYRSEQTDILFRLGSRYRSGRSPDWLKMKNPDAPAVKREAEEDWGKKGWQ